MTKVTDAGEILLFSNPKVTVLPPKALGEMSEDKPLRSFLKFSTHLHFFQHNPKIKGLCDYLKKEVLITFSVDSPIGSASNKKDKLLCFILIHLIFYLSMNISYVIIVSLSCFKSMLSLMCNNFPKAQAYTELYNFMLSTGRGLSSVLLRSRRQNWHIY